MKRKTIKSFDVNIIKYLVLLYKIDESKELEPQIEEAVKKDDFYKQTYMLSSVEDAEAIARRHLLLPDSDLNYARIVMCLFAENIDTLYDAVQDSLLVGEIWVAEEDVDTPNTAGSSNMYS